MKLTRLFSAIVIIIILGCSEKKDTHSYANTNEITVTHLDLDINVDFDKKILSGRASLSVNNFAETDKLILDSRGLTIYKITLDNSETETAFTMGSDNIIYGRPLIINISQQTKTVHIFYQTSPDAQALQWLTPSQTAGKKLPFLFTQSQSIFARTWVPCQDTPAVRMTYSAKVKTDPRLMALMSASNPKQKSADGIYYFEMKQPIPAYLLALAVGDLEFKPLGKICGVYAEPAVIDKAVYEFADTEKMISAAENLYGPYLWERYDILVLPPSFPYGGMENPRLTFATPTILAGDRSLVSLIAHELAHSWSGNLVTNATWDDIWMNEGFTVYFEMRIMEALYGKDYTEMIEQISYQDLQNTLDALGRDNPDTRLAIDLSERSPEDAPGIVYDKGFFFLKTLENAYGREKFDDFLKEYFSTFAFQTMTSEKFLDYLYEKLVKETKSTSQAVRIYEWVYGTGLPDNCPVPNSPEFHKVDLQRHEFLEGKAAKDLNTAGWTTHHWIHFLRALPGNLTHKQMFELDDTFNFTTRNAEIQFAWFVIAINKEFKPSYPALEKFLLNIGRIKLIQPLYLALSATKSGRETAERIFSKARAGYHPATIASIQAALNL